MFRNAISLHDTAGYRLTSYVNNKSHIVNSFYYVGTYFRDPPVSYQIEKI